MDDKTSSSRKSAKNISNSALIVPALASEFIGNFEKNLIF
mgnify:CR=1 FL=1